MSYNPHAPLLTTKGKEALCVDGRVYQIDKGNKRSANGTKITSYFHCENYPECKGRYIVVRDATTNEQISAEHKGSHNPAERVLSFIDVINRNAECQVLQNMRAGETKPYDKMCASLRNPACVGNDYVNAEGYRYFVSRPTIASSMTRAYQSNYPRQPTDVFTVEIPEDSMFRQTTHGHPFLIYQGPVNDTRPERMFIFASYDQFVLLCNATQVFIDGTFKCVPVLYHDFNPTGSQLITIHAYPSPDHDHRLQPLLYALLAGKSIAHYVKLFRTIQDFAASRGLVIRWTSVMTDFEPALRTGIEQCFGAHLHMFGCHFHFCQCIYRRVSADPLLRWLYLLPDYQTGSYNFRLFVHCTMCLPFVPPNQVVFAWNELKNEYNTWCPGLLQVPQVQAFVNYFQNQWMADVDAWNLSTLTTNRTNNAVEGWHRFANGEFGAHPTFWRFLDKLRYIESLRAVEIAQVGTAQSVTRQSPFYQRRDARIERMKGKLRDGDIGRVHLLKVLSREMCEPIREITPPTVAPPAVAVLPPVPVQQMLPPAQPADNEGEEKAAAEPVAPAVVAPNPSLAPMMPLAAPVAPAIVALNPPQQQQQSVVGDLFADEGVNELRTSIASLMRDAEHGQKPLWNDFDTRLP